ncbi:hypothetical protein [Sphingomonas sp.]|uniref:hypothetical protein n=1 Tax=Sphingomonas sp. TaxID=28214 RepID=UPI002DD66651|nr:hypothetical protein [Sphingomonas sp.]
MPIDISHLPHAPAWFEPIPSDLEPHRHTPDNPRRAVHEWLGHIAAGRIGTRTPTPPQVAANRDATAALFARIARERHA